MTMHKENPGRREFLKRVIQVSAEATACGGMISVMPRVVFSAEIGRAHV